MSGVIKLDKRVAKDEAEKAVANDPTLIMRRAEALKEGYKDEICPKCKILFIAHHHFIRCAHAINDTGCPMHDGKPSILKQILSKEENSA